MHNIAPRYTRCMRLRSTFGCLFGLAITIWVVAWIAVTAQGTPTTAFVHVNVIDGTGAPLKADQTVVIANGRIVSVVPVTDQASAASVSRPEFRVVLNWMEELKQRVPVP